MKKHKFSIFYGITLISFTVYMVLNTFVISSAYQTNAGEANTSLFEDETETDLSEESSSDEDTSDDSSSDSDSSSSKGKKGKHSKSSDSDDEDTTTQSSYSDGVIDTYESDNAEITLTQYTYEDTKIYVADVTLSSAQYLKTAFAEDTYGKNVTETTSSMASSNDAILAINGDNYGSQESGYVIRNGVVYRDEAGTSDILCIFADGSMEIYDPDEYSADELVEMGVWQAFSFGPALVEDGEVVVSEDDEVGKAKASNPRTAIGMIDELHYLIVVSDGRTDESEGLSLYELAEFMQELGATTVYNLDGGGSSTMVFNGTVINNPTSNGSTIKEREVNDIVYIG
ncbi:MAG: phosphodiester glycosidase family protein [Eubacterium sp.]|nr:phosphodiester glycosidase family protein [Eubacterium sp.]